MPKANGTIEKLKPYFRDAIVALLAATALYWRIDARLTTLERDLAAHLDGFGHDVYCDRSGIVHPGFHVGVDAEIRRHVEPVQQQLEEECRQTWRHFFSLNPDLTPPRDLEDP